MELTQSFSDPLWILLLFRLELILWSKNNIISVTCGKSTWHIISGNHILPDSNQETLCYYGSLVPRHTACTLCNEWSLGMRPLLWATVVALARDISHVHTMPTVEGVRTRTNAFSVSGLSGGILHIYYVRSESLKIAKKVNVHIDM